MKLYSARGDAASVVAGACRDVKTFAKRRNCEQADVTVTGELRSTNDGPFRVVSGQGLPVVGPEAVGGVGGPQRRPRSLLQLAALTLEKNEILSRSHLHTAVQRCTRRLPVCSVTPADSPVCTGARFEMTLATSFLSRRVLPGAQLLS